MSSALGNQLWTERWERSSSCEIMVQGRSHSPSSGKPQEGSQWMEWEQGTREGHCLVLVGNDRWRIDGFRMCLEVELIGHGCEERNQGGRLGFERPEHLGRW